MVAAVLKSSNENLNDAGAPLGEVPPPKPRNLGPVHAIIPPSCYTRSTAKGLAYFGRDMTLWALTLVTIALTDVWWQLGALWILGGFIVCGLFVIGHDAAHGSLFSSDKLNGIVGRIAMLPSLHVYEAWAYGHNRVHHGHTAREHMDFVWHPVTPEAFAALSWPKRLRTRLEWSWLGAGFYYGREIWYNRIVRWQPPKKYEAVVKKDRLLIYAFAFVMCAGLGAFGALTTTSTGALGMSLAALWMIAKVLVAPFLVFTHMIGWTVYVHHIHPDIVWWSRRNWNPYKGQMESTHNWDVGPLLNFFWHNIFVHIPHHVDMRIPFYHLPQAHDAIKAAFPDVKDVPLSPATYLATTKQCKLYDFENQQWLPYAAAGVK